jgi:hypothetical protein
LYHHLSRFSRLALFNPWAWVSCCTYSTYCLIMTSVVVARAAAVAGKYSE